MEEEVIYIWRNVLKQVVNNVQAGMTPKQAFLAYVYPNGLPNLTRDVTNEAVVDRQKKFLIWPKYEECTFLPYQLDWFNESLLLSEKYVVFQDNTVLKFD